MCTLLKARLKENISSIVKSVFLQFSYTYVKPCQEEAITTFVSGSDVFVSLPTGYGKSICYAALPFVFDAIRGKENSVIIVISPLNALIKDQVDTFRAKGIKAVHINESFENCCDDIKQNIITGSYSIIYISPELLLGDKSYTDLFRSEHYQECLVGFIVDEAHCITKWGKQFRKEYAHLGEIRGLLPNGVHIMALTATATKYTRKYICKSLSLVDPVMILRSPEKDNIVFKVCEKTGILEEVFALLVEKLRRKRRSMEKTVIFCRTFEETSHVYLYFRSTLNNEMRDPIGYPDVCKFRLLDMFTSCTTEDVKEWILQSFIKPDGRLRIVVATVAFGMGLDCPNIRTIIHWSPPSDIESYIQESGRAGRDGDVAHALLYYSKKDLSHQFMEDNMKDYCTNKLVCRRHVLYQDFDTYNTNISGSSSSKPTGCLCCDICAATCCCCKC